MQIVTHTPERLVLRSRHSILTGIAWLCAMMLVDGMAKLWAGLTMAKTAGMALAAAGFAAMAVYCLRPAIWVFDRTANRFEWTRPGLLRSRHGFAPLDSIARVRIDAASCERNETYRVVAEAPGDTVPFEHMYSSGERAGYQRTVDFIRAWLRG